MARPRFLPSAEQIASAARRIRASWDEREHRKRAGQDPNSFGRWSIPEVSLAEIAHERDVRAFASWLEQ
ncbi:MAG: hypothetical protein ACC628_22080 [Pirellulaceae bacterium]